MTLDDEGQLADDDEDIEEAEDDADNQDKRRVGRCTPRKHHIAVL